MRTLITTGGRVVTIPTRPCTPGQAAHICAQTGLPVRAAVDNQGTVDLYPTGPVTTLAEVRLIASLRAATDAPIRWHRIDSHWSSQ